MITDAERQGDPVAALKQLPRGSVVILRDYDHGARKDLGRELARHCRRRGLLLLIAGTGTLAARVRAGGVHFPEKLVHQARAWRIRRRHWLITVAAHSLPAIFRARKFGADAVLLSPAFPTESHAGASGFGALRFARLIQSAGMPVYALGGITSGSVRRLKGSGATGIAAIGAFAPPRS
jgi:thiamine-phosphate pyrophosphorylase